jgi:hypothetical protein
LEAASAAAWMVHRWVAQSDGQKDIVSYGTDIVRILVVFVTRQKLELEQNLVWTGCADCSSWNEPRGEGAAPGFLPPATGIELSGVRHETSLSSSCTGSWNKRKKRGVALHACISWNQLGDVQVRPGRLIRRNVDGLIVIESTLFSRVSRRKWPGPRHTHGIWADSRVEPVDSTGWVT